MSTTITFILICIILGLSLVLAYKFLKDIVTNNLPENTDPLDGLYYQKLVNKDNEPETKINFENISI